MWEPLLNPNSVHQIGHSALLLHYSHFVSPEQLFLRNMIEPGNPKHSEIGHEELLRVGGIQQIHGLFLVSVEVT